MEAWKEIASELTQCGSLWCAKWNSLNSACVMHSSDLVAYYAERLTEAALKVALEPRAANYTKMERHGKVQWSLFTRDDLCFLVHVPGTSQFLFLPFAGSLFTFC